ncbi:MAG: DUF1638 domain-containing protein [Coriobacteriia bacterium]|nr:DUF1638 domain-containing protein [Coriobacteriia bacterium]
MRYIKLIACRVMLREVSLVTATSDTIVDVTWLPWGLHDKIGELNAYLQREIDSVNSGLDPHTTYPPAGRDFEAIVCGYGLCSNGTVGLKSTKYPLVIPRAHDCITLFLGSKEKYRKEFDENPGTYWYSAGWAESGSELSKEELRNSQYLLYVEQYGEELAEEMADMFSDMMVHYSQLGLIKWPEFAEVPFMKDADVYARQYASEQSWDFKEFKGDSTLMRDMLGGNWDDERFIVIKPGYEPAPSYDDAILKSVES